MQSLLKPRNSTARAIAQMRAVIRAQEDDHPRAWRAVNANRTGGAIISLSPSSRS